MSTYVDAPTSAAQARHDDGLPVGPHRGGTYCDNPLCGCAEDAQVNWWDDHEAELTAVWGDDGFDDWATDRHGWPELAS